MSFTINIETPLQDDVRELIAELNSYLLSLFPAELCSHLTVEQMSNSDTTVFIARDLNQKAVACGALRRHPNEIGEIKRMYTKQSAKGNGLGLQIVAEIEILAKSEGYKKLVLETGIGLDAAHHIYEKAGFRRCGPVLHYSNSPISRFYEKHIN